MAGAVKNLYTQFSFCFFDRIGNRSLGHKKRFCSFGNGMAAGNFYDVSEILNGHDGLLKVKFSASLQNA